MSNKPTGFTVIELMMVIGVLSILLSISLPTITTLHSALLRKRAESEASMLAQAVIRYKSEYGFWPGQLVVNEGTRTLRYHDRYESSLYNGLLPMIVSAPKSVSDELAFKVDGDNTKVTPLTLNTNELYRALARIDRKQEGSRWLNLLNPKGIRFLPLKNEDEIDRVCFPDPWGNPYVVFMGLNPKSTFTHEVRFNGAVVGRTMISNVTAFAYSFGAEGANSTNYIYNTGIK
ncbi:MAG: prepilin-type N-terminal cleavage/methylation domain-containing protein [Kiritimatiellae bacterium]|nr:prepilin-type N-terminal cleavage/methylation domain-containing protein [Kiritimatiellia bacterium]